MATLSQLRSQLRDLQREEERLRRDAEANNRRIQSETNIRLNSLQRGLERAIQENNATLTRQFRSEIDRVRRESDAQIRATFDNLSRNLHSKIEAKNRELLQQLEAFCREKEAYIRDTVNARIEQEDQRKADIANEDYAEVKVRYEALVMRMIHSVLFPGRLEVLHGSLNQVRTMIEQKQYEAASATAVMLGIRLKDLDYEIDQQLENWIDSFTKFQSSTEKQSAKLQDALTVDGETVSWEDAKEWLNHQYNDVFMHIEVCEDIVRQVHDLGDPVSNGTAERYLLTLEPETARSLDEKRRTLEYILPDKIVNIKNAIESIISCREERRNWLPSIISYMKAQRNVMEPVFDDVSEAEDSNSGRTIEFCQPQPNGKHHLIYCKIVPVENNGHSENHVRLRFVGEFPNPTFQQKYMEQYIFDFMKHLHIRRITMGVGSDESVLDGANDQIYSIEKDPKTGKELMVCHRTTQTPLSQPGTTEESTRVRPANSGTPRTNSHRLRKTIPN